MVNDFSIHKEVECTEPDAESTVHGYVTSEKLMVCKQSVQII